MVQLAIASDHGCSSFPVMSYPFIMKIGYNVYSMNELGVVFFLKRDAFAARGCKCSLFSFPPGSPHLQLGVTDPKTVKLVGYSVSTLVGTDILVFHR